MISGGIAIRDPCLAIQWHDAELQPKVAMLSKESRDGSRHQVPNACQPKITDVKSRHMPSTAKGPLTNNQAPPMTHQLMSPKPNWPIMTSAAKPRSVAISVRLEGALSFDADVISLLL